MLIVYNSSGAIIATGNDSDELPAECTGFRITAATYAAAQAGKVFGPPIDPVSKKLLTWDDIRRERDFRIASCDWTAATDSPLTADQKTAWAAYRTSLRNITTQASPNTVIWPTQPTLTTPQPTA